MPPKKKKVKKGLGLKVLSVKVRDIVFKKKFTTYKDVAEILIKRINVSVAEVNVNFFNFFIFINSLEEELRAKCQKKSVRCFKCFNCGKCFKSERKNGFL